MTGTKALIWGRRIAPLALLLLALGLFFALGLHRALDLDAVRGHHAGLQRWIGDNPLIAWASAIALAAAVMAMAFPSIGVVMAACGLVFGLWQGFAVGMIGATIGGVVLFLAARSARGALLDTRFAETRIGRVIRALEQRAQGNALMYLISLRLMPLFPTNTVTLAAAAAHLRLDVFVLGTIIGSGPAAFVFTSIGSGAGAVLDAGGEVDLVAAALAPTVLGPLLALTALALFATWMRARLTRVRG